MFNFWTVLSFSNRYKNIIDDSCYHYCVTPTCMRKQSSIYDVQGGFSCSFSSTCPDLYQRHTDTQDWTLTSDYHTQSEYTRTARTGPSAPTTTQSEYTRTARNGPSPPTTTHRVSTHGQPELDPQSL